MPKTSTQSRKQHPNTIVYGVDPGGLRMGKALIHSHGNNAFTLLSSSVDGLERNEDEPYALHRRKLIEYHTFGFAGELEHYQALAETKDASLRVMFEQIPAASASSNFINPQSELAKYALAVCQSACVRMHISWGEIAAVSVKKLMTGDGHASKARMRRSVTEVFPQLLENRKLGTIEFDETDAIAIGLTSAGYQCPKS